MRAKQRLSSLGLAACLVSTFLMSPDALAQLEGEGAGSANLRLDVVSVPAHIRVGDTIQVEAVVTNFGPDAARNVVVLTALSHSVTFLGMTCRGRGLHIRRDHLNGCLYARVGSHESIGVVVHARVDDSEDAVVALGTGADTPDPHTGDNLVIVDLDVED